jgi:hypothetical protein
VGKEGFTDLPVCLLRKLEGSPPAPGLAHATVPSSRSGLLAPRCPLHQGLHQLRNGSRLGQLDTAAALKNFLQCGHHAILIGSLCDDFDA